jgi:hypothetical protein
MPDDGFSAYAGALCLRTGVFKCLAEERTRCKLVRIDVRMTASRFFWPTYIIRTLRLKNLQSQSSLE